MVTVRQWLSSRVDVRSSEVVRTTRSGLDMMGGKHRQNDHCERQKDSEESRHHFRGSRRGYEAGCRGRAHHTNATLRRRGRVYELQDRMILEFVSGVPKHRVAHRWHRRTDCCRCGFACWP